MLNRLFKFWQGEPMKRLITMAGLLGVLWVLPNPTTASAETTAGKCVDEAVASCDDDFSGGDRYTIAIRGWCYIIRTGICLAQGDDEN
jgi:hypothetical protein